LRLLHERTKRNIIAYYSGWFQSGSKVGVDINDRDINGFMASIHEMDCSLGLDLLLHTPGGSLSATEHLVYYLKSKFGNNIRAYIPQIALSAGTMLACSCSEIFMGKQSSLGPIDPQMGGVSARGVLEEFKKAVEEAKENPASIPMWQTIIGKYHPTFIDSCVKAWDRSQKIVTGWLAENMFSQKPDATAIARNIVQHLSDIGHSLGHDKHISIQDAITMGLKIIPLEDDQDLQDDVLTVHHCYMHTFSQNVHLIKAIENHRGIGIFEGGPKQL